jgi:hypothetical protein
MAKHILNLLFTILVISSSLGQSNDYFMVSYVYDPEIKSVSFGSTAILPVMTLGAGMTLKFDDMSGIERNFFYRIIHCDRNWQPSGLRDNDYIDGFNDEPIRGFTYSINTRIPYIHYNQSFPNRLTKFKMSGNYVILIYEDSPENPILTQRVVLCENTMSLDVQQVFASDVENIKHKQEFTVDIFNTNLKLRNPQEELSVVMVKNSNWNSARTAVPYFIANDKIRFNKLGSFQFWGGVEHRFFDTRSLTMVGRGVEKITRNTLGFNVDLTESLSWNDDFYTTIFDYNGGFYIDNEDGLGVIDATGMPLFSESPTRDINSDYVMVNFSLKSKVDLFSDEDIYILGAFNNWQPSPDYRMDWDEETRLYKKSILLKQGYYNYSYTVVNSDGEFFENKIDGSWSETENDVTAIIYFKGITDLADRAVGFQRYNTQKNVKRF